MRILIDTHVFLWLLCDPDRLSINWRSLIEEPSNELYLSIGSLWEIAIKASLKKLSLPIPFRILAEEYVESLGIDMLPITLPHLALVESLPRHHADPFDRLLIAQAVVEQLSVMSVDSRFGNYPVTLVQK